MSYTHSGLTPAGLNRLMRAVEERGKDLPWHIRGGVRRIELGLRAWSAEQSGALFMPSFQQVLDD